MNIKTTIFLTFLSVFLIVFNIKIINEIDECFVSFCIHPINDNRLISLSCKSKLAGWKYIKNSNGETEKRPFINTSVKIGKVTSHKKTDKKIIILMVLGLSIPLAAGYYVIKKK